MTAADIALAAFAFCNSVRVFAYVPQIVAVARDRNGATAISYTTWTLFGVSHLSTVAYAVLVVDDWRMAAVFAANTVCCGLIVGLTAWKRAAYRKAQRLSEVERAACETAAIIVLPQASLAVSARPLAAFARAEAPAAKAITGME